MITTHVLDTSRGRPAGGVPVVLEAGAGGGWTPIARAVTDDDGRVKRLVPEGLRLEAGPYRLTFEVSGYFEGRGIAAFYPTIQVIFLVAADQPHYHVPLLLSPFGYSTYRGS
jgi:5-hydroxyisourate hydrolase